MKHKTRDGLGRFAKAKSIFKTIAISMILLSIAGTLLYHLLHSYLVDEFIHEAVAIEYKAERKEKVYAYNEQVPVEVVKAEIIKQANFFSLNPDTMLALAKCESGFNNLIPNKQGSTAVGVYQYLIGTWNETASWKNKRIARTDYKANIREAMIDVSNGEIWRWRDCREKLGI